MKSIVTAALALLAVPATALAQGFTVDMTRGDAVRAIGGTTVGDLAVGDSGYIPTGFYGWCLEGKQLYVPLETQVVQSDSYDAFLLLTVQPDNTVVLESYAIEHYPQDFDYHLHFPACRDLVAAGAITTPEGYPVASIDGATTLSEWLVGDEETKNDRRPKLPSFQ